MQTPSTIMNIRIILVSIIIGIKWSLKLLIPVRLDEIYRNVNNGNAKSYRAIWSRIRLFTLWGIYIWCLQNLGPGLFSGTSEKRRCRRPVTIKGNKIESSLLNFCGCVLYFTCFGIGLPFSKVHLSHLRTCVSVTAWPCSTGLFFYPVNAKIWSCVANFK